MIHLLVAFALLLQVLFWGAGAAVLLMPRPWARFWPILAFPAGVALQSAVVWLGAYLDWPGTNRYGFASLLVPVALLGLAARAQGLKRAWTNVSRFGLVWAAVGGCLGLLTLPLILASKGLTTTSLGSCDAADYAAGARVLMEFARSDRDGFIGLTEVVRVHSVDNFFDYWLRLNHFTPAALLALNGTLLFCAPHELASLLTAVLLAGCVPTVFWVARTVIGYSGGMSLIIAGLFGLSPVMWYAVAHVSPGQLLAAPAIALLTWSGVALWRGRLTARRALGFAGVMVMAYWILLGSYNFIVLVCLVPAVAYAGGQAIWRRQWLRFGQWLGWMLAPLVVAGILFAPRVAGLAERFLLLQTYDFGWRIPALTAEGWLGMVRGPDLAAWEFFGLRWFLTAGLVGLLVWAHIRAAQQRRRAAWAALAVSLPILAGYLYLQARGARLGTNASYDAYKLFAVFYPLLLPAFCWWVTLRRSARLWEWLLVVSVGAVVVAFNVIGCGLFIWKLSRPPLIVDGELRRLRTIETMADVASVNLRIPDMWSRLWANAFLLRKPHYFPTHTYEGRLNTPLRGQWDLESGPVALRLPGDARRPVTARFALVDTRHPEFVRGELGTGWYQEEWLPGGDRWHWSTFHARIQFMNPQPRDVRVIPVWDWRGPGGRQVQFAPAGSEERQTLFAPDARTLTEAGAVVLPPGVSEFTLRVTGQAGEFGDPRELGVTLYQLRLLPDTRGP